MAQIVGVKLQEPLQVWLLSFYGFLFADQPFDVTLLLWLRIRVRRIPHFFFFNLVVVLSRNPLFKIRIRGLTWLLFDWVYKQPRALANHLVYAILPPLTGVEGLRMRAVLAKFLQGWVPFRLSLSSTFDDISGDVDDLMLAGGH